MTLVVVPRARRLGDAVGGLSRTKLRATGGTVGLAGAGVEDQGFKDNQVGSILISLAPQNRPPGSKATDPGRSSTTADGTTMARSPAATAGATILGGNALPETAPAVPAIDQVTGPLCAGALHLSSDEALTEGPGSSSLGLGLDRPYRTLKTAMLTRVVMCLILTVLA